MRIIDESGEDYLYPASYFEPVVRGEHRRHQRAVTVHLDDITKDILHAEAVASKKSVSSLLRDWIDERLDTAADIN